MVCSDSGSGSPNRCAFVGSFRKSTSSVRSYEEPSMIIKKFSYKRYVVLRGGSPISFHLGVSRSTDKLTKKEEEHTYHLLR